jgi:hypothetical protein
MRPFQLGLALAAAIAAPASAQDEPIGGPMKICLRYSSFDLLEGERLKSFRGGVESMRIWLDHPGGGVEIGESQIFASRESLGKPVAQFGETRVYRAPKDRFGYRYLITGPTDFDPSGNRLVVVLSGSGFDGSKRDATVYGRFRVADPSALKCGRRFLYGWEFMEFE